MVGGGGGGGGGSAGKTDHLVLLPVALALGPLQLLAVEFELVYFPGDADTAGWHGVARRTSVR